MNASGTRLSGLTRELWLKWQQTKDSWRDSKSLEFEQQYLSELLPSLERTVASIEQLDNLLKKIRKDCE